MTIYSIDNLTLREIKALRKSLDSIPITGIDAAFIAMLQHKTSTQIQEIENHIKKEEIAKQGFSYSDFENNLKSDMSYNSIVAEFGEPSARCS